MNVECLKLKQFALSLNLKCITIDFIKDGIIVGDFQTKHEQVLFAFILFYCIQSKNIDIYSLLKLIKHFDYEFFLDFKNRFKDEFQDDIIKFIEYVSSKQKTNTVLFKKKQQGRHFEKLITFSHVVNAEFAFLAFIDNNVGLVVTNKNIICQNKTLCTICLKDVTSYIFQGHICKLKKCKLCFRYVKDCRSNDVFDIFKVCNECEKPFTNHDCFIVHKSLTKSLCKLIKYCKQCQTFYRSTHKCFMKMCTYCFRFHEGNNDFCLLRPYKIKPIYKRYSLAFKTENTLCFYDLNHFHVFVREHSRIYSFKCQGETFVKIKEFYFAKWDALTFLCNFIELRNSELIYSDDDFMDFLLTTKQNISNVKSKDSIIFRCSIQNLLFCRLSNLIKLNALAIVQKSGLKVNLYLVIKSKYAYRKKLLNENIYLEALLDENSTFSIFLKNQDKMFTVFQKLEFIDYCTMHHFTNCMIYKELFSVIDTIGTKCSKLFQCSTESGTFINFTSLAKFGQNFLLLSMQNSNIISLPVGPDKSIYNTSRAEICFARAMSLVHKNHIDSLYSYVTRNGQQFSVGNLSADVFCEKCKVSYFIEVNMKAF